MDKRILWTPVVLMVVLALVAGCTSPTDVDISDQPTAAPGQPTAAPEQPALEGKPNEIPESYGLNAILSYINTRTT